VLATTARTLAARLRDTGSPRDRVTRMRRAVPSDPPAAGLIDTLPERPSGGILNPAAVPVSVHWDGASLVSADVVIDELFAGGLGRAHGGVVAALFDDVLSHFLTALGVPAVSRRLTVDYDSPTPTGVAVTIRGTLVARNDRELVIAGEIRCHDTVTARAELTMAIVDEDRFSQYQ